MISVARSFVVLITGCISLTAAAQQSADQADSYIYATYYVCDLNQQDEADRVTEQEFAPLYNEAVNSGQLTGWGWLAHQTGGPWRRAFYMSADSIDALLTAQASLAEQEDPRETERFNAACGTHDDYIWRRVASSEVAAGRGSVSLSTYYVCDIAREDRANEIFEAVLAPLYQEQMRAGRISSWGWNEHVVGGAYRKLGTVTGDDWPSIFLAIDAVVAGTISSELGREIWDICDSHADYMWNIETETETETD